MLVKVGPRGQITIPKSLRYALQINPGDTVALSLVNDEIKLRPVTETLFNLRGFISVGEPQDFTALREKAKQHVAQKVLESLEDE